MKAMLHNASLYATAAALTLAWRTPVLGQGFAGDVPDIGLPEGADEGEIKDRIADIIVTVLNFLAIIAVVVVIIAGIRLIVSQGEEEAKEKAKKTILYALIGLIIVLFARVIVGLVTEYLFQEAGQ